MTVFVTMVTEREECGALNDKDIEKIGSSAAPFNVNKPHNLQGPSN
jgi:hypothetical protein